jgi:hypothetical protein
MKLLAAWTCLLIPAAAQGLAPGRVLGEALAPASAGGILFVQDQRGARWAVRIAEDGEVVMVGPGAKDLSGAAPFPLSRIEAGDRLLARGAADGAARILLANSIVVMSRDALEAAKLKQQSEWRTRGIAGSVESVDAASGRVLLKTAGDGSRIWTVAAGPDVKPLRYSDESVRFADAREATLADVRPADQMRVVGEKDDPGGTIRAEKIVFGSFRTLGGEITSVNLEKSRITIRDVQTKKPVVLALTAASNLRRMPQSGAGRPPLAGPPGMGGAPPGAGFAPPGGPAPGMPGPRRPDLQQMLDRMAAVAITDLTPGDAVIVSAGRTAGPQPWPVVSLVSGAGLLLRAPAAQVNQTLGNWSIELPVQ